MGLDLTKALGGLVCGDGVFVSVCVCVCVCVREEGFLVRACKCERVLRRGNLRYAWMMFFTTLSSNYLYHSYMFPHNYVSRGCI